MIWHQHQLDMIGHQHPIPHRNAVSLAMLGQKITIGGIIGIREEGLLPVIAPLRDMVRHAGNHISRQKMLSGETMNVN